MERNKTISDVVENGLCTGCGICVGICPSRAILLTKDKGLYIPKIDKKLCKVLSGCNVCIKACPGHEINIDSISEGLFPEAQNNLLIGRYLHLYTGYASDHNIRYHSASGGLVTAILTSLLKDKIIDGALVVKMSKDDPLAPEVVIARSPEELFEARSSKYCPVPTGVGLREIIKLKGKYIVVGLPCHIHGFRKAEMLFPELKDKILLYFGLFCSSTKTFPATQFILKTIKVKPEYIKNFSYRDEGCLGNMKIEMKDGKILKYAFKSYYPVLRSFFIPCRCTLCPDHTAELADVSFGDIHIPEFWNDKIGVGSLIVRSEKGESILSSVKNSSDIILNSLSEELLIKSQMQMLERKKKYLKARVDFLKIFGKKIPSYHCNWTKISLKQYIKYSLSAVILYSEISIGRFISLWFLVDKINYLADLKKGIK